MPKRHKNQDKQLTMAKAERFWVTKQRKHITL